LIPIHDDNPTRIKPYVTLGLIGACVLVFLWQLTLGDSVERVVFALGAIPAVLFNHAHLSPDIVIVPAWVTPFTSMFLHGGWMHLIGNMLFLWIFGNNVEDAMGHVRFFVFYVLCGLVAVFAEALPNTGAEIPMIGASGAISGVLGAYLLLYPHARVLVVIPLGLILYPVRLPAVWVLAFWFVFQLVSSLIASTEGGGVAFGAHIGGFLAGMALIPLFKHRDVRLLAPGRPGPP
jgi:membrane associated rhomboid family serine protease